MSIKYASRVKEVASNKPNTSTAFNLPDSAPTGYQSFDSAFASADTVTYYATNGVDWEEGLGTFTSGTPDTLTRTAIYDSSTGSAIDWSAGGDVTVFNALSAGVAQSSNLQMQGVTPGGRLTLTTGVPVTSSDVASATSVYYTPYLHNIIPLWDGYIWRTIEFSEVTQALGTLTSGLPYDVFGYLSGGVLATEILAWTSGTARATDVTLQDGRYCKSGDKTRLYLGSFYTTSTTTTEDSSGGTTSQVGGKRFLWNMYNRVRRTCAVKDTTNEWAYTTNTIRQANAAAGNKVELLIGLPGDSVEAALVGNVYLENNASAAAKVGVGVNSTTAFSGLVQAGFAKACTFDAPLSARHDYTPAIGYSYLAWLESGAGGTSCSFKGDSGDTRQSGLTVVGQF